jgi:hypothetical protein
MLVGGRMPQCQECLHTSSDRRVLDQLGTFLLADYLHLNISHALLLPVDL